jgi:uroporphyrin-III C-methyltransferase / precorrin-2 dehydrogenase / sirohydrochlorin ferrochelatase
VTKRASGRGLVSLVGAGPGDPDLLTVRALRRLRAADLVLYDGLVSRQLLTLAPSARLVSVARRVGPKALSQDAVNRMMIAAATKGLHVVRLKSGDPFVFGRGGEEAEALRAAGIHVEVVPGLSTALAAPALAGIPITYRQVATAFVVVSGHAIDEVGPTLDALPAGATTLIVLMGLGSRAALRRRLVKGGWAKTTPVAIVTNASRGNQTIWRGRLAALGLRDAVRTRKDPGVIIIGDVVAHATPPEDFPK